METVPDQIPNEESYLVEFKSFSGGISVSELAKTISAFANTDGGILYIGVTDQRLIQGVKVTASLLDQIQNAAREGCSPPVPISLKEVPVKDRKSVLAIRVEKSGRLHSTVSGQTHIRVGTQDKRILGEELLRLAETKSQVSYEEEVIDAGMDVIDPAVLEEYYKNRRNTSELRSSLGPEDLLLKIGLAKKTGSFKIKAGAFILFGKEGEQLLLQRDFTFVRYESEGTMYTYREEISLPVTRLMDRLMELIRPYNQATGGIRDLRRQESYLYPEEAIREALLNAFAHRDYRIAGLKNECRLYPGRLEVISAGGLPSLITLENIGRRHYSRNPKIMHALLTLRLVEELGQGISMMKESLKKNGNPPPEFQASTDQFRVVFRRPRVRLGNMEMREIIERHFAQNTYLSRQQIEAILGIKSTRAKYLIQNLVKEGFLEKEGRGPGVRYKGGFRG